MGACESFRRMVDMSVSRSNILAADVDAGEAIWKMPPLHPRRFAAKLAQRTFTNGSDIDDVICLYANTLVGNLAGVRELHFSNVGWTSDEFEQLAEVLPFAKALVNLELHGNDPEIRGLQALSGAVEASSAPELRRLTLND